MQQKLETYVTTILRMVLKIKTEIYLIYYGCHIFNNQKHLIYYVLFTSFTL